MQGIVEQTPLRRHARQALIGTLSISASSRLVGRCLALVALLSVAGLLLASCKETLPPCPLVKTRTELNQITKFSPGAPIAQENVLYASRVRGVAIKCTYAEIESRKNAQGRGSSDTMEVNFKVAFETLRGPAGTGGDVKAEYFVVVTDLRQTVLNREVFPVVLRVPSGGGLELTEEETWMRFDLGGQNGLAFEIYVGFQLTDEEKAFNQRLLGGS